MVTTVAASPTKWAFRTRLRKNAFGWRGSQLAIARISEALAEIRAVARHDAAAAAGGAVLLLEKLSPSLGQVDGSSGALGSAAYAAVQEMVPVIANAPVGAVIREKWLERLFDAIQDDDPPYIESLGDRWGDLCPSPELASSWADRLLPIVRHVLDDRQNGVYAFFSGASCCYRALFKAGRHDELLEILAMNQRPVWTYIHSLGRAGSRGPRSGRCGDRPCTGSRQQHEPRRDGGPLRRGPAA